MRFADPRLKDHECRRVASFRPMSFAPQPDRRPRWLTVATRTLTPTPTERRRCGGNHPDGRRRCGTCFGAAQPLVVAGSGCGPRRRSPPAGRRRRGGLVEDPRGPRIVSRVVPPPLPPTLAQPVTHTPLLARSSGSSTSMTPIGTCSPSAEPITIALASRCSWARCVRWALC